MAVVDVNHDKKISFEEFWNWWQFGKNEKLEKLVFLKLRALSLLKNVHAEFTRFGIPLEQVYESKYDHHYYCLNYGDSPSHAQVDVIAKLKGGGVDEELAEEKIPGYKPKDSLQIVLKLQSPNPAKAQSEMEAFIENTRKRLQTDEDAEELRMIFDKRTTNIKFEIEKDYVPCTQLNLALHAGDHHPSARADDDRGAVRAILAATWSEPRGEG